MTDDEMTKDIETLRNFIFEMAQDEDEEDKALAALNRVSAERTGPAAAGATQMADDELIERMLAAFHARYNDNSYSEKMRSALAIAVPIIERETIEKMAQGANRRRRHGTMSSAYICAVKGDGK